MADKSDRQSVSSDTLSSSNVVHSDSESSPLFPNTNQSRNDTFERGDVGHSNDYTASISLSSEHRTSSGRKYNLLYFTFLLMGMGSLLPYNMFINATDYFNYKLRDISSNLSDYDYGDNGDESTLQKQFESYFTTFSTVSLLLMVFGNTLLVRCMSSNIRLVGSIVGAMLCFVPSIGLVKAHTNTWQVGFFAITIVNIVALNIVCATLQSASVGVANVIATTYTQAVIAGQAVAGIFSSVVQIICLAIFQDSEDSALLYFLVAEAFLVILLVLAVLLLKNPTYCAAQAKVETENSTSDNENSKTVSMVMGETFMVFKRTLPLGFSVSFVFFVTLVIFPNFMAHIEPTDFEEGRYWYPVTVFLIFNVFDFIGRVLAGFFKRPSGTPAILMLCLSRSVFLVLYLFTNYQERYHLPVWFHSDYIVITFNILLALSNGYMASICFIYGARDVGPRADLQEQAGAVLTFFLSFGLCSGSALSFLYIDIP